jgi:hypothetical protein
MGFREASLDHIPGLSKWQAAVADRGRSRSCDIDRYGRLVRCDIPATHNPQAKPYSFVEFRYEEDAEDAYKYM